MGSLKIVKKGTRSLIGFYIKPPEECEVGTIIQGLRKCFRELSEEWTSHSINSFSIPKLREVEESARDSVVDLLRQLFHDQPIRITICSGVVEKPVRSKRHALISEAHTSAIGGHTGITLTCNRLRIRYHWENMKDEVQLFVQQCLQCKLKKLTRTRARQPMMITDNPGAAFEKVALYIVGPFPTTENGNKWILTMQCLLTKFCIGVPLMDSTAAVPDAFLKRLICIHGAPKVVPTREPTFCLLL